MIDAYPTDDVAPEVVRDAGRAADVPAGTAGDWSDARLHAVLGALSSLVMHFDASGAVTFVNDALLDATGAVRAEVIGAEWGEGAVPAGCQTRALIAAALGGMAAQGHGELLTRSGGRRLVTWDIVPVRELDGRVSGAVCVGRDVTDEQRAAGERARIVRELAAMADHDPVTGLANRLGFLRGTVHAVQVAARTRRADAVLCIRVHELAAAYAAQGVAAGDDAVCAVAEALRAVVRESDVVARVGVDTFAIYAVGTAAPDHGVSVAIRVRAALDRQNARARGAGRAFDLSCTVGVAEREPGDAVEAWLARAAAASAAAPRAGVGQGA